MKTIKKLLLGIFTLFAVSTLVSCSLSETEEIKFVYASNKKLAYSATTALSILDTEENINSSEEIPEVVEESPNSTTEGTEMPSTLPEITEPTTFEATQENGDIKAEYLPDIIEQADLILSNDANFSFISIESDRDDYLNHSIISFNDYEGTTHTFKLYYNDVLETVDTDDDEEETKVNYSGLLIYNELEYTFDFESETEAEEDEIEVKTKLVIYTGDDSYISIKNECEKENDEIEEKFTYKVVENNEVVVYYSISNETENDKTKVKVIINGETIKLKKVLKGDKHYISMDDGKFEALFEGYKDENGNHKHHLVENNEEYDPNFNYEEMKKHFEEHFTGFDDIFKNKDYKHNDKNYEEDELEEAIEE